MLAGVVMGLAHFLYLRLHPRIIEVGLHPDGSLRDRHLWKLPPLAPHLYALRMDAELDFASASAFERAIVEHLAAHPDVRHVCLFAQPINRVDATGVEVFGQLRKLLDEPRHPPAHQRPQAAGGARAAQGRRAGRSAAAEHVPHRRRSAARLGPARPATPRRCRAKNRSGSDDPPLQGIEVLGQAVARRPLPLGPGGLQQAEHGVEAVAAGVLHQRVMLRVA